MHKSKNKSTFALKAKGDAMMEERKMILKMIEEGKVTAEEGLKLLEAIGEEPTLQEQQASSKEKGTEQTSLSTFVDWDNSEQRRSSYREPAGSSFLTGFLESAIQKIREFDLDFNFGSYIEIDHIFQHRQLTEKHINISVENGSVKIKPWDEEDVRVECVAKVYRAHNHDEARHMFLSAVKFESDGEHLSFVTNAKSVKLEATFYVPKTTFESFKLYSFNGHFKSEQLHADAIDLKVVNGSIYLDGTTCKRIGTETVNGPIELLQIHAGDCSAKTVNGAIRIAGKDADSDVETVNGTIHYDLEQIDEACFADLKAATGSVYVKIPKNLRVDGKLKTNVGGFSCDLTGFEVVENKKEFIQKTLRFTANQQGTYRMKLEAETNAGSIELKQD